MWHDIFESDVLDESNFPGGHRELIGYASDGVPYTTELGYASDGVPYTTELGFASDDVPYSVELGYATDDVPYHVELGYASDGVPYQVEIGAEEAVKAVLAKARDNRQPPPRMRAVDLDAPPRDQTPEWSMVDVFLGVAEATGNPNPFPLTTTLLQRFGGGGEPRIVQVDTESSHEHFRAAHSPERAELLARVADLEARFARHIADPMAHQILRDEVTDLAVLGAEVDNAEAQKKIALWMPQRFAGTWEAWREGANVFTTIRVRGLDGEVKICTSAEPLRKSIAEMARHAAEANVPAGTVVDVLPAMGAVLGAATAIKEMAAGAESIRRRPEALDRQRPFRVRLEPKACPAVCALLALLQMCQQGNVQACEEWKNLGEASPPPVRQAMTEAVALLKGARA